MFANKTIILVDNGDLKHENINEFRPYLKQEVEIANKELFKSFEQSEKHSMLYNEIRKVTIDHKVTDEQIDIAINNSLSFNCCVNPALEIIQLINNLSTCTPEHCAIIQILYDGVVLGSVSVTIDRRLTLFGGTVAYMIGIRKSTVLFAAQKLSPDSEIAKFKITQSLVAAVTKYSLERKAEYIVVTPIGKMISILENHHGFKYQSNNIMKITYKPPCFLMECKEEPIYWKKIRY